MIRKLPPHLIQQIAAGEVIERPASVMKELIENALDAKATKVDIVFRRGGLDLLSVEDNGTGIDEADLALALEAHATSKLSSVEDLEKIMSLGFRGEALAATAAVADLTLETASQTASRGSRLRSIYGQVGSPEPIDKRVGTKVEVRGLFHRIPARLKFLKSERSEALAISQVFRRYVLAYPLVAWSLLDEGSKRRHQLGASRLLDRALWFFDAEDPDHWTEIESESSDWKIRLIFQKPRHLGQAQKGFQVFLNNRPLKDIRLESALRRGFEGFTEFPREMSAALFVEGRPQLFDVNVHPTKMEVRFLQPDPLFSLIVEALRKSLNQEHMQLFEPANGLNDRLPSSIETRTPLLATHGTTEVISQPSTTQSLFQTQSVFEFLYAIDSTYLVCRRNQELVLFDQHALHERILYERFLKTMESNESLPSQRLLFPLKVSKAELGDLIDNDKLLKKLGYELRDWDAHHMHILMAPAVLKRRQIEALLEISEVAAASSESLLRNTLATMACHAAVRAHDPLSKEEIENLLSDFSSEDSLGHCPHGRPTFVKLGLRDLEKMFHRVI